MKPRALALCAAVITACVALWAALGEQVEHIGTHLALYAAAFAAYLGALRAARGLSAQGLRTALAAAVLWRAVLVAAPPLLSNDVYRSLWEGRVQLHGGNPYAWRDRPEAPRWTHLRDDVWRRLNHKNYTAIYPPLWQLLARGMAWLHHSVTAMKAFLVACELVTLAVLARSLRRRRLPRERLLVLAWSPLSLVEVAGSGHNEAAAAALLALSLAALDAGRPLLSALCAGLGGQVKLLPALVAAAWARRYRVWHLLAAAAAASLLVLPYRSARQGLWRSLVNYGQFWRFNETVFALLAALAPTQEAAVALALALLVALVVALAVRGAEPVAAALVVVTGWLLLSPSVLPWYALWLLPLLVLRDQPALLLFTGTIQLAYLVYPAWMAGEPWRLDWRVRALEYLPCLLVALWTWKRRRSKAAAFFAKDNG